MASRHSEIDIFVATRPAQSAQQLMRTDGELFVRWAYVTLLGRLPEEEGLAFYLRRMGEGKTKTSVLKQISRSPEGRAYGLHLPGLEAAVRRAALKRAPVIGPVYRWLLGSAPVKRLPAPRLH
ncbi:hypothetical protein J3E64_002887 [Sphingobium sp. OAS761]|uniref:DUF4214 domain-containing protein n=1 Tax=Sphingobium sp. OAS761 TaxID=2817901 RepID=UPI0020A0F8D7|nr:DUF4214 domain-containing protein [Sphingobium sp. OAS761]MCP1471183.1 hypothetical protein [Sphingobium sp. OAS761]